MATKSSDDARSIVCATWNIAAVNNNPFEYWITPPPGETGKSYADLMRKVETFVLSPGKNDVRVDTVFTDKMFGELMEDMTTVGWTSLPEVRKMWNGDLRKRKIITEFLCDNSLGKKRLASMPDRITNTIGTADAGNVCRPTLINCYAPRLDSVSQWWPLWRQFLFDPKGLVLATGKANDDAKSGTRTPVFKLFSKIRRSKYPALTELEEQISVPLQTLCLAIFDAILVHMINTVVPASTWHPIKLQMAKALNMQKNQRTIQILESGYSDADVVFLQEVSTLFLDEARASRALNDTFAFVVPPVMNKRDQNSVILIRKSRFLDDETRVVNITNDVLRCLKGANTKGESSKMSAPVSEGDVVAARITCASGERDWMLCSFHGDTHGLASLPILRAVHRVATAGRLRLVFGLDANTYRVAKDPAKKQSFEDFRKACASIGIGTCWGSGFAPSTTFNARTFLQPQLNKSVRSSEMDKARRDPKYSDCEWIDRNPKDFILYFADDFRSSTTMCDNSGMGRREGAFCENRPIPTTTFPSDHAVLSTFLSPLARRNEAIPPPPPKSTTEGR